MLASQSHPLSHGYARQIKEEAETKFIRLEKHMYTPLYCVFKEINTPAIIVQWTGGKSLALHGMDRSEVLYLDKVHLSQLVNCVHLLNQPFLFFIFLFFFGGRESVCGSLSFPIHMISPYYFFVTGRILITEKTLHYF